MKERSSPETLPDVSSPHIFPEVLRKDFRHRLAECLVRAKAYDGTEATYQALLQEVQQFEQWEFTTFQSYDVAPLPSRLSDSTEHQLLAAYHPLVAAETRTISGLLTLATKRCSDRLRREDDLILKTRVQTLGGALLPTGKQGLHPVEGKGNTFTKEFVFSPRIRTLLASLQAGGVYLDDVVIWVGDVPKNALKRQQPYVLVEIPRLQGKQVLVCDQVGEATFVATQLLDKQELLTMNKATLLEVYGDMVRKVPWQEEESWKTQVMDLVFLDQKPGEKVDIALREVVRQELKERYNPAQFLRVDPKTHSRGYVLNDELHSLSARGMGISALAHLFGQTAEEAAQRTSQSLLRFLVAVYGMNQPEIKMVYERFERDKAVQLSLGKDPQKWREFILGKPVTVQYLGKDHLETADPAFPTKDVYFKMTITEKTRCLFAGRNTRWLANIFLSDEEIASAMDFSDDFVAGKLFEQQMARALFGTDPLLEAKIVELEQRKKLNEVLGKDIERWGKFIQGEPVSLPYKGQTVSVVASPTFPTRQDFLSNHDVRNNKVLYAGHALNWIATDVLSSREPELVGKDYCLQNEYLILLVARGLYGTDPDFERQIYDKKVETVALAQVGKNKDAWRSYIKGNPLTVEMNGASIVLSPARPLQSAREMLALTYTERAKTSFLGKKFSGLGGIFLSKDGKTVIINTEYDVMRLALEIYGDEFVNEQERLSDRILEQKIQNQLLGELGQSRRKWREFVQGHPVTVEVDGQHFSRTSETVFPTKKDMLAVLSSSYNALSFGGLSLMALATRLGLDGPRLKPVRSVEGYRTVVNTLFEDEE